MSRLNPAWSQSLPPSDVSLRTTSGIIFISEIHFPAISEAGCNAQTRTPDHVLDFDRREPGRTHWNNNKKKTSIDPVNLQRFEPLTRLSENSNEWTLLNVPPFPHSLARVPYKRQTCPRRILVFQYWLCAYRLRVNGQHFGAMNAVTGGPLCGTYTDSGSGSLWLIFWPKRENCLW